MQRILISAWLTFVFVIFVSIAAYAQSHPIYDTAPVPGGGSHPNYDTAPNGDSHPTYDSTLPPPEANNTGIGRSINNLNDVVSDLTQTPPDPAGRRDKALRDANAALKELYEIKDGGQ